jgi:signal transduction histidine kinase
MRAQELLSAARGHVYRASIYVRDALLDETPDPEEYRRLVDVAYRDADAVLVEYQPVLDTGSERDRIARLRAEIDALRVGMGTALGVDSRFWQDDAGQSLLRAIRPRRDTAIAIAEELQALNRGAFVQHQTEMAAIYRQTQRRFWQSLGVALLASLGIALVAGIHASRLEARVRQQHDRTMQHQADLQRLSAKLLKAQEEERRTIARELHDEVGQVLTAVKVELSVAQRSVAAMGGTVQAIEDARQVTDRALSTVRDLSRLLHPSLLDDIGLPAALDWYLKGFRRRHEISAEFQTAGLEGRRLTSDIEVNVYRIVQEALTNVVRHAQTTSCRVDVVCREDELTVVIADHGVGFVPDPGRDRTERGLGLVGIGERVAQLGGTFEIQSEVGMGTVLTIQVPARFRADAADPAGETPAPGVFVPAILTEERA